MGGPRIAFGAVSGAVTVTLVLLLDFRFTIDIVPSLLNVVGAMWGFLVTALIALLLASLLRPLCESVPSRAEASR